ncbi:hypothetical protein LUZ63_001995 [Rhynchospora breviuscula]|uniref:Uncharacterized protein n=1 Tax=Rhynchospora breviuscula TaxID=2022672 RepID=A0A9Q0CY18_9POAL|nr:hypothetical protein LUZ63_001995 [Rhynchospora breviuscula]
MGCDQFSQMEGSDEEVFFDSREDVQSVFDSCPCSPNSSDSNLDLNLFNWVSGVWTEDPVSVQQRREKFTRLMCLDSNYNSGNEIKIVEETNCSSSFSSSISSLSTESSSLSDERISEMNLSWSIKNLDDGTKFVVSESSKDGAFTSLREIGSNREVTLSEFEKNFGSSTFIKELMRRQEEKAELPKPKSEKNSRGKRSVGWLKRLGVSACIVDREGDEISTPSSSDCDQSTSGRSFERVKVRAYKKKSKELSAVYGEQAVKAHDGAILTIKFSPDGQYLASGGEDGVVRIWQVLVCERNGENGISAEDPHCIYFRVDGNSELAPLDPNNHKSDKEKKGRVKFGKKCSDSACIVIPPNFVRISEEPLHEFRGHNAEVLDISWSKDKRILSSSTDKTVRLWQVGCGTCLGVFQHKNYVTGVQFNPTNESYFVSSSIDGKVRVWAIPSCHVVDWVDVREIVTAVCYRPDGKEVVVGTINGNCRFYDASDKTLQMEHQVSLNAKKKSPLKRVTGFQFCPSDNKKLMVTSADSKVCILDGANVICKYKGVKSGCTTPVPASFTASGHHIICCDEDSNIYLWNHSNPDPLTHLKTTYSCERFSSPNASIALPWNGSSPSDDLSGYTSSGPIAGSDVQYLSPSGSFTLNQEFLAEALPRGTATWPEEKLPSGAALLNKSQCKFLKTACQNESHAWGQVILTAGWDGLIRVFQNYGLPVIL